ncbi:MAG TPA: hypothetical protein VD903_11905 [Pseudonocardia sp.]|nr:hypothetical protein [Pseudonocardia sp.]
MRRYPSPYVPIVPGRSAHTSSQETSAMSTFPPSHPGAPEPGPQPPRKLNRAGVVAIAVAALIVGALCAAFAFSLPGTAVLQPGTDPAPGGMPAVTYAAETTSAPVLVATPGPGDFKLQVEVLDRDCFGSAGCHIMYRVTAGWDVPVGPDPWLVTYEVRGVDDGPAVGTLTVNGDTYDAPAEEFAQVKSAKSKLSAVAIRVSRV